jgi:ABC-type sugar transport system ATPase subunit
VNDEAVLSLENLRKVYPGTVAVENLTVRFEGGKVHAVIGKNGSGKSTTIKMISGAVAPTRGSMRLRGQLLELASPRDAMDKGIATVYQELSLVPGLTVAENLLLGRLPHTAGSITRIDWRETDAQAERMLSRLGIHLDLRTPVKHLSVGQQQLVEIAKAVGSDPDVLILDEPTSALARHEVDQLFQVIRNLRDVGITILYISHRLQELPRIADTVSVLRDGELVGRIGIEEATPDRIVSMMFGEVRHRLRSTAPQMSEHIILRVDGLSRESWFEDVTFNIREGEVLGLAGMLGSGRTELLRSVFGADPFQSGTVTMDGQVLHSTDPEMMKRLGVAFTPENRATEGLILRHSIQENLTRASMRRTSRHGLRKKTAERGLADRQIENLDIRLSSLEDPVATLSGGNQQKVVIGNWLGDRPRLILFDEPSRGIDVNAKQQIFELIWALSREGIASLFVSTELEELLDVCDRIIVLRDGRIQTSVSPAETSLEQLYALCMEE